MKRANGQSVRLALAPLAPGESPNAGRWNLLFPGGDLELHRPDFPGGVITFDGAFFAAVLANWEKAGRPELPVDYFHRGETGDALPLEEKVAAGWISDLRPAAAGGLEALISWTERARGFIEADELRYLSPTFATDANDKAEGGTQGPTLFGAALLNDPFLQMLPRVAASAVPPTTAPAATNPKKEQHMDKKQICENLGLPGDATDEMLAAAFAKAKAALSAPVVDPATQPAPAAMAALSSKAEKLELANDTLKTSLGAAVKRVEELEAASAAEKMTRLCDELVAAKKVSPAQREAVVAMAKATTIDEARKFFTAMPTLSINTTEKGHGDDGEETTDVIQLNAEFNKELDAKVASGMKVALASRELRALPKYRPLLAAATEKN